MASNRTLQRIALGLSVAGVLTLTACGGFDASRSAAPATSATSATSTDGPGCGWTGDVNPLIAAADKEFAALDLDALAAEYYGEGAQVTASGRREVDVMPAQGTSADPVDASALTANRAVYSIHVALPSGHTPTGNLRLNFDGLCFQDVKVSTQVWIGTTGYDTPAITLADALAKAQQWREANPDEIDLQAPLAGAALLQPTTAPPDFGLLRWYVNYQVSPTVTQVIAVYMDGTTKRVR